MYSGKGPVPDTDVGLETKPHKFLVRAVLVAKGDTDLEWSEMVGFCPPSH